VEDILCQPSPDYLVPYQVEGRADSSRISFCVFDNYGCADAFLRDTYNQCLPRESRTQVKGNTYDTPWLPSESGQFFICFKNDGNAPECYVRVEAVAILK
jgi:hypothetical protein